MPPIRFLHAAGIDPDAVLPRLPASPGSVFDAAPLAAIERLIDRAISLEVDFLLISPAVRTEAVFKEPGFRGMLALRRAFARLTPHAIPAFLAVESDDQPWNQLIDRDTSVSLLPTGRSTSVTNRDGEPLATLRCIAATRELERPSTSHRHSVEELLIAPTHSIEDLDGSAGLRNRYCGFGLGSRRSMPLVAGLAHAPGAVQALSPSDCGPHGATLVTIDGGDEIQTEFVPTAAVRYESLSIRSKPGDSLEDVAVRMSERLAEQRSEAGEQFWNVRWMIEAGGELFETLFDPAQRAMLGSLLPETVGDVPIVHRLTVVPHPLWPAIDEPFAAEFAAALVDQESDLGDAAARRSPLTIPPDMVHRQRFELLLAQTDIGSAMAQARRLGLRVIQSARETNNGS